MKYYVALATLCFAACAAGMEYTTQDVLHQMQETVRSLYCRVPTDRQAPCFKGNVTAKRCKSTPGCCLNYNDDDSLSCYKMKSKKQIRREVEEDEMYALFLIDEDVKRKNGDITMGYYINCLYGHYYEPGCQKMCTWYPWGAWSGCEGQCGVSFQKRIRRCNGCVPGEGNCVGNNNEHKPCSQPTGQQCGYWSGWSEFSSCSTSCGMGYHTKTRQCLGGQPGEKGCIGVTTVTEECNNGDGHFYSWGQWSSCSVSCGGGYRSRTQAHSCGYNANLDKEACNIHPCCNKLPWTQWSPCSVTCSVGRQTRTRRDTCDHLGPESETRGCDAGPGNYGAWSAWGACSQTCDGGYQYRKRSHSCGMPDEYEPQKCGDVGYYTVWSEWSTCSQTCLGGLRSRKRSHTCGKPAEVDSEGCGYVGDYYPWQSWSACSSSCPGGEMTRYRYHQCNADMVDSEKMTCGQPGGYSNWGYWSACSQSCVGGTRTRHRHQACGGRGEMQSEACGEPGAWGEYSEWSTCTKPCGTGKRYRSRVHSCPANVLPYNAMYGNYNTGMEKQEAACNSHACCYFHEWGPWSACSTTCSFGMQTRTKTNSCPAIAAQTESKYCNAGEGVYLPWNQWSACTQSCPGGTQKRSRTHTCDKPDQVQKAFCGVDAGYGYWSEWDQCSKTCGGGYMTRRRYHICATEDPDVESAPCNTDPGVYLPPGPWGPCSQTCPGGQMVRTSKHTCGGEDNIEVEECGGPGSYGIWSQWSACSSTCTGEQTRYQTHSCGVDTKVETRVCGYGGSWGEYTSWSTCTQTCYGGNRFRHRFHSCPAVGQEKQQDTEKCGDPASYGPWTYWGPCSVTCGKGVQTRTREGICGNADQTERAVCGTKECCSLLPWSQWSACSTTCFTGQQERTRSSTCSQGNEVNKELRECSAGDGAYKDWSPWTPCPTACGVPAARTRMRDHTCLRSQDADAQECPVVVCAKWSFWSQWSPCSKSCFDGVMSRSRNCINGTAGEPGCMGYPSDTRSCVVSTGSWEQWGAWSQCSATCNGGMQKRYRAHTCGLSRQSQTSYCNTQPGKYNPWGTWTECSKTCGNGMRKRYRTHTCGQPRHSESEYCNTDPGYYYEWSQWSTCTATCAGGDRTRSRYHSCGLEGQVSVEACNTHEGKYNAWSSWTMCSQTCGGGTRTRHRDHDCALPSEKETESCNDNICPYWSGWTMWSQCSATCDMGERRRSRECQGGIAVISEGCRGSEFEVVQCHGGDGEWLEWDNFSPCDATCNGGHMTRRRRHSCSGMEDIDRQPCNTDPGMWAVWASWTTCSRSCGEGMRTRHRSHTCGLPQQETDYCTVSEGQYTQWSRWTECSRNCNGGVRNRTRSHTCGVTEYTFESERCNTNICAYWGGWSNYGPCSKTCGHGSVQTRSRQCIGGKAGEGLCYGEETNTMQCAYADCCDWNWSGWGKCCKEYDQHVQIRMRGNECGMDYDTEKRDCDSENSDIKCDNDAAVWSDGYPRALDYRP